MYDHQLACVAYLGLKWNRNSFAVGHWASGDFTWGFTSPFTIPSSVTDSNPGRGDIKAEGSGLDQGV